MAQFETQLSEDGFKFDGFEVCAAEKLPSVSHLTDEALRTALRVSSIPVGDKVEEHRLRAVGYWDTERYADGITNLRLTLKFTLEGVARKLAKDRKEQLPSEKEADVRNYLRTIGFLSEEEWRGVWGIYGLLSAGPHGNTDKSVALLSYAAGMLCCHYVLQKLHSWDGQ
jgi:hypothetical protein